MVDYFSIISINSVINETLVTLKSNLTTSDKITIMKILKLNLAVHTRAE